MRKTNEIAKAELEDMFPRLCLDDPLDIVSQYLL